MYLHYCWSSNDHVQTNAFAHTHTRTPANAANLLQNLTLISIEIAKIRIIIAKLTLYSYHKHKIIIKTLICYYLFNKIPERLENKRARCKIS